MSNKNWMEFYKKILKAKKKSCEIKRSEIKRKRIYRKMKRSLWGESEFILHQVEAMA